MTPVAAALARGVAGIDTLGILFASGGSPAGRGGLATWLAACRCQGVSAASAFYGRRITELNGETPKVPIILHFGKADASIPMERVEEIREAHPETPIYLYDAGHGFVSDRRADYDADSARLARLRTLALFANNGGGRSSA